MTSRRIYLKTTVLVALATLAALGDVSGDSRLHRILRRRDAPGTTSTGTSTSTSTGTSTGTSTSTSTGTSTGPAQSPVSIPSSEAQDFLAKLSRTKRNLWDRNRPDVQQWIMQFLYMGFDEERLEADLSYWRDHARSNDPGRQHHYDENAPIAPRDATAYRHGANVNYDYY
ncbi:augurin-A [Cololabis saira]|uniref:augurin-A n=1 Tax=Cololabis saira TaxID=129043 RepID=UPI002AD20EF1|nr:augurin-A [Cololabis saira]